MSMKTIFVFCALLIGIESAPKIQDELFELSIIHLNDFHARFEEINKAASPCKRADECIGGFSRVYAAVQGLVKSRPNAIFLNAGDNYQGTIWYNIHRWNVTQHFLNKLPTDAYTLGNHEFDNKIEGVVPFMKSLNAPTLVANINDTLEPNFQGTYQKSTVIVRGGRKIGIIGVIAKNTNELSSTENLHFLDEAASINQEAARLTTSESCNIVIVLSHCGVEADIAIAERLSPHVNLVVGGHSHTLLYSGAPPSGETPRGPYPTVVTRPGGRKVLVVQAAAYTKYLGNLTVWYDQQGEVVRWEGNPVFLGKDAEQDPEIDREIDEWKKSVDEYSNRVIGSTNVVLSNEGCHIRECNLGNFLTDAMVNYFVSNAEPNAWTYAALAIMNSGGIRTTLSPGNITYGDIVTVSPFESTIDVGELTGEEIKEFFEYSVDDQAFDLSFKQFLQVSGMKIVFDLSKPLGSRVTSLKLVCRECTIPKLEPYKPNDLYRIALPSFIANGGDGYATIRDKLRHRQRGPLDIQIFEDYIVKTSPVVARVDGRIVVLQ